MRFIDFLNENTNSKSRTDKWTLDQIKNAEYSDSFMNDREEVCIKGKSYVKIGKNEWQYFSTNPHVIGGTYTDNEIYKMMHESVKNDDKIVFHDYHELRDYCDDPNNPLDRVALGKEINDSLDESLSYHDGLDILSPLRQTRGRRIRIKLVNKETREGKLEDFDEKYVYLGKTRCLPDDYWIDGMGIPWKIIKSIEFIKETGRRVF